MLYTGHPAPHAPGLSEEAGGKEGEPCRCPGESIPDTTPQVQSPAAEGCSVCSDPPGCSMADFSQHLPFACSIVPSGRTKAGRGNQGAWGVNDRALAPSTTLQGEVALSMVHPGPLKSSGAEARGHLCELCPCSRDTPAWHQGGRGTGKRWPWHSQPTRCLRRARLRGGGTLPSEGPSLLLAMAHPSFPRFYAPSFLPCCFLLFFFLSSCLPHPSSLAPSLPASCGSHLCLRKKP